MLSYGGNFYYGIFPETEKNLGEKGITLHKLCTWWDVFEEAKKNDGFDSETLTEVREFLEHPRKWQEKRSK